MYSVVTVLDAAESIDLVTLSNVKLELGITSIDEDAKLRRWITQASRIVANYCKRSFARETISETFRWSLLGADRSDKLELSRKPVSSITSVTADDVLLESAAYELDASAGLLYQLDAFGKRSYWSFSNSIVVVYVGGYFLPSTILHDVERAVISIVKDIRSDATRDPDLISEDIPGVISRRWWVPGDSKTALPLDVTGLLDPYVDYRNS